MSNLAEFSGGKRRRDERDAAEAIDLGMEDGSRLGSGAQADPLEEGAAAEGASSSAAAAARGAAAAEAALVASRGKLHLRGVSFLLTWPKCDRPLKEIGELLRERMGDKFEGVRVAAELHKDGTPHRHAYLILKDRSYISEASWAFDIPKDPCVADCSPELRSQFFFRGDYKVAARPVEALAYVSKGGDFVDIGVVNKPRSDAHKANGKLQAVVGRLKDGATPAAIFLEFPDFYFMQRKRIEEFASAVALEKELATVATYSPEAVEKVRKSRVWPPDTSAVLDWIGSNICSTRRFKQRQLFLHGPPNVGKTSLILALSRFVPVYFAPTAESFFDQFDESYHRLVAFDEFKGQHLATFMNQFLEMGVMTIRKKGSQMLRKRNLPVIINSNFPVEECYPNAAAVVSEAFSARVITVKVENPLFPLIRELTLAHGLPYEEESGVVTVPSAAGEPAASPDSVATP